MPTQTTQRSAATRRTQSDSGAPPGLVLILPVDWFVGIARALTNLIGNCVATVVVAVWEHDIDKARAKRVLNLDEGFLFVPAGDSDVDTAHGDDSALGGKHAHA